MERVLLLSTMNKSEVKRGKRHQRIRLSTPRSLWYCVRQRMSTTTEPVMTPVRLVLGAAIIIAVLGSVVWPYALFPIFQGCLVAGGICLLHSTTLAMVLRKGGLRVQIGLGTIFFVALVLTSACVGVFFYLPLKQAFVSFAVISVIGSVLLVALSVFLSIRVFPDLLANPNGERDGDDQSPPVVE